MGILRSTTAALALLALSTLLPGCRADQRKDLYSLSKGERRELAKLILQYVDDGVVAGHSKVKHGGPEIFPMHREMLGQLESYLATHGGAKFVPLPKWDPGTPIPPEFNVVRARDNGTPRQGLGELNPRSPKPEYLAKPALKKYPTVEALANAVIPWHNVVHLNIAGIMVNLPEAPAAPIFWCWHATVDDIYGDWLETGKAAVMPVVETPGTGHVH